MTRQGGFRRVPRALARGRGGAVPGVDEAAAVSAWLGRYRGHTHTAYKRESSRFLDFVCSSGIAGGLVGATPAVFEEYARTRPSEDVARYGLQVLRSLYATLCERGVIKVNPVPVVKGSSRAKPSVHDKHFTQAELVTIGGVIDALAHEPGGHRRSYSTRRWIFWLLAYTGAQREEIAASSRRPALTMGNLHCFRQVEHATATCCWVLDVRDSAGLLRRIRLGDALVAELVRYRQSLMLNWHPRPDDETPLIVGNGWRPMGAQGIYTNVQAMFAAVASHLQGQGLESRLVARLEEATPYWLTRSFYALDRSGDNREERHTSKEMTHAVLD
ncbi:hypothetical protein LMG22037_05524 [Paraburkholderia phenoliruptrix]|uniref:Core-binding (CB) domain-containing protein n=1 Tax=Paraburkholderia phenoliruptrix TaxID=252970 RepID=A0A6J5C9L8_9BURK|nr:hypothetical protein LMG22037_05524 [Paraburkholderia phenoliruptrix]